MTKKKDKKTIQYGEMNQLYDNQDVVETVDMSEQNFVSLSRKAIKSNLVNSDMLQGRRLGFILQKIKPEKKGFFDSLFSKPLAKYYVRIPEIDAHLPQPKIIGEPARKTLSKNSEEDALSDQEIIELHDIYEPKAEDDTLSSLSAGDRVWVSDSNGKFIILESLKAPPGSNKGGKGRGGDVPNAKTKGGPFRGGSGGTFRGKISFNNGGLHPTLSKDLPLDTAKEIASYLIEAGASEEITANILAMAQGDSKLKLSSEPSFSNETVSKIRKVFGTLVGSLSDTELEELKKDDVKFYDLVYKDTGGHKFIGRGFIHVRGETVYKRLTEEIDIAVDYVKNPEFLMAGKDTGILATYYYYFLVVPEAQRGYEDFLQVYTVTKGVNPNAMADGESKEFYLKDFEKRKKTTEGWLDYVKRNVTFSIQPTEYTIAPGGPMVAGSEEMKLATEAHNSFLASYLQAAPQLKSIGDAPMPDKALPQIDLEEVELSQLVQFPICSNGYNFIAPLQGIPDYGSEFLGVRGGGNHLAMDQFVPDSNMTTKIRAIGPGRVTGICHSTTYDNYCKQFQTLMRQHFYGKPGIVDDVDAWCISKGYNHGKSRTDTWRAHANTVLPSNYGQMGWEELRTWMNSLVPNNTTKFGAVILRYMRAKYGSFMHAGGASVTLTYDPDHNGVVYTQYSCHMGEQYVNINDRVEQGQVIGLIGLTAIFDHNCKHLHFQMESFENGSSIVTGYGHKGRVKNRLNPREIIPALSINREKTKIKFEGIYSPSGTHAARQKSRIVPVTPNTSSNFEPLSP